MVGVGDFNPPIRFINESNQFQSTTCLDQLLFFTNKRLQRYNLVEIPFIFFDS